MSDYQDTLSGSVEPEHFDDADEVDDDDPSGGRDDDRELWNEWELGLDDDA